MSTSYIVSLGLGLGAIHALSGPDHLISLLPFIIGRRAYVAFFYGAIWGLGHSVSTSGMGIATYLLKYSILPSSLWLERIIDIVVGVTLVMIGILGLLELKNSINENDINIDEKKDNDVNDTNIDNHNSFSKTILHFSGVLTNGIVLGLSWDAIPSLTPAVSITSWNMVIIFIIFYGIGTSLAISISSAIIGESSYFILNDILLVKSKLPITLAYFSSIAALIFGMFWILYAFISYYKSFYTSNELNDGTASNIVMISATLSSLFSGNITYYLSIIGIILIIFIVYKKRIISYSKYHSG